MPLATSMYRADRVNTARLCGPYRGVAAPPRPGDTICPNPEGGV